MSICFPHSVKADKSYELEVDSRKLQVFCKMTDVPECGGGAWTLIMKINGSKVGTHTETHSMIHTRSFRNSSAEPELLGQTEHGDFHTHWGFVSDKIIIPIRKP